MKDTAEQLLEDGSNGLTSRLCVELYEALKELTAISGEAHIELGSVKAVRKMAKFMKARTNAQAVLDRAELKAGCRCPANESSRAAATKYMEAKEAQDAICVDGTRNHAYWNDKCVACGFSKGSL